jgi:hypothetical protein
MTRKNEELYEKAKYLYHRTSNVNNVISILKNKRISLRSELSKWKGLTPIPYVSLTTNIKNSTGGKFLIVFDKEKIASKNNLVPMQYGFIDYIDDKTRPWMNPMFFEDEKEVASIGGLNFDQGDIIAILMDKLNWFKYVQTSSDKTQWTKEQNKATSQGIKVFSDESELMKYANY